MKLILMTIISSLVINLGSINSIFDRETVIPFEKLPAEAQKFLNKHFQGEDILSIVLDSEIADREYSVYYENGTEVKFDSRGNWESMEHEYSSLPDSVIPEAILKFVNAKHPEKKVTSISRDMTGRDKGYEVELDNLLDVKFDIQGRFMRYDD